MQDQPKDEDDAIRRTRGLAALAVVLALAVAAIFLFQQLKRQGELEDCLLAHGTNCDATINRR